MGRTGNEELDARRLDYGTTNEAELAGLPRTCGDLESTADLTSYSGYREVYLKFVALRTCGALRFLRKAKPAKVSLLLDGKGQIELQRILAKQLNLLFSASQQGVIFSEDASYAEVNQRMSGDPADSTWTGSNIDFGFSAFGDIDGDGFEDGLLEYYGEAIHGSQRGYYLYVVSSIPGEKFYRFKEFELREY